MKSKKSIIIALSVLLLLIIATIALRISMVFDTDTNLKTINVTIINDENSSSLSLDTNAEYLRQALEEHELIAGDESAFGLFVTTVNGITVNNAKNEWWCFTKNSEMLETGVDDTPIADGDSFEITLSTY